jgi:hypothetical protein
VLGSDTTCDVTAEMEAVSVPQTTKIQVQDIYCLEWQNIELTWTPVLEFVFSFLGACVKPRKATVNFVMSVFPHGTTRIFIEFS